MKAIVTVGISGSGKSMFAAEWVAENEGSRVEINRDEIRGELYPFASWDEYKFSKEKERKVTEVARKKMVGAYNLGMDIIVSDTNLNPAFRNDLISFLTQLGYDVEIKEFDIGLEQCIKNDNGRVFSVGQDVIWRQWKQWIEYKVQKGDWKKYTDKCYKDTYIFDLDGTLAEMHGRGPFDWDKVGNDKPVYHVINLLASLSITHKIVILSGRDECCREQTEKWLYDNLLECYDELLMRKSGDTRKDSVVKEELFWDKIAPKYSVAAVVDDRPQVIRECWMKIGVPVICVGDPYTKF